jgi:hypothetical protein
MSNEGFMRRWSKRKLDVKQGKAVEVESKPVSMPVATPPTQPPLFTGGADSGAVADATLPEDSGGEGPAGVPAMPPPPTQADVEALTAESDFTRFAAADVTPEVKNAAMKKLFADPRYNVMDGLDVYIDDYSKPDPMPYAMLRKLASAKFLGLFDEEEKQEEAARQARDVADNPTAQSVAQSSAVTQAIPEPAPEPPEHADPDLRLQQDHAASGKDPGRGTG